MKLYVAGKAGKGREKAGDEECFGAIEPSARMGEYILKRIDDFSVRRDFCTSRRIGWFVCCATYGPPLPWDNLKRERVA